MEKRTDGNNQTVIRQIIPLKKTSSHTFMAVAINLTQGVADKRV